MLLTAGHLHSSQLLPCHLRGAQASPHSISASGGVLTPFSMQKKTEKICCQRPDSHSRQSSTTLLVGLATSRALLAISGCSRPCRTHSWAREDLFLVWPRPCSSDSPLWALLLLPCPHHGRSLLVPRLALLPCLQQSRSPDAAPLFSAAVCESESQISILPLHDRHHGFCPS